VTRLIEVTQQCFGDAADRLLEARAILPLNDQKNPKACRIPRWQEGVDPYIHWRFHSLAVLTGQRSDLTVWDFDGAKPPIATPNVVTTKGAHVYTKWDKEGRRIGAAPGLDVLGEGGYAIFYGPDKTFVHPRLSPREPLQALLPSSLEWNKEIVLKDSTKGWHKGMVLKDGTYNDEVVRAGYCLDTEAISRGYVYKMLNTAEGKRNHMLFRYAIECSRCGIPTADLEKAAVESGLDPMEVAATIDSAEAAYEMDTRTSVLDRVIVWLDTYTGVVPDKGMLVMKQVGRHAVEQNDLSPFVVQSDIIVGVKTQQGVSKVLELLQSKYGALKTVPLGRQENGWVRPNCYRLCMYEQPIDDVME